MVSEGTPSNGIGDNKKRIRAIAQFNRELEALVPSLCSREKFMEIIGRHAVEMFDMTQEEARGLVMSLDTKYYIPSDKEIDDFVDQASDLLRSGLFMDFVEEYALMYSQEEFREWIEPFMQAMLFGHIEESISLEHLEECVADRFCPATVLTRYVTDTIGEGPAQLKGNELYLSHANEIINMHISILEVLEKFKLVEASEVDRLLDDYRWWIESFDVTIGYDVRLFES